MRTTSNQKRSVGVGSGLALMLAAAIVYWPVLRAFLIDDDFLLLAFARLLRDPLALFAHEHFSIGPYFRPLSMSLWWASAHLFGNAIKPQYVLNLCLHVGVSLALWHLLRTATRLPRASFLLALMFATHPIAIGTASWLSDRFDLLCSLFALLAMRLALEYRRAPSSARLFGTIALCSCAVLSKETGLAAAVAVIVMWLPAFDAHGRNHARAAAAAMALAVVAWIMWRAQVAGAAALPYGQVPLTSLLWQGGISELAYFASNLTGWARLSVVGRIALCTAVAAFAAGTWMTMMQSRSASGASHERRILCAAALLAALAAIAMQAPITYTWRVQFVPAMDVNAIVSNSRLFYFPLCCIVVLAGLACSSIWDGRAVMPQRARALLVAAVTIAIAAWSVQAHKLARDFRRRTIVPRELILAAVDAVARAPHASADCHVYLLGIGYGIEENVLKTLPDAVVKALIGDLAAIQNCLLQSEQAAWLNLVGGVPLSTATAEPLTPAYGNGLPLPWLQVGGVQVVYLDLPASVDARAIPQAVFLARFGDRFEDVTAQIRSGERRVQFFCARASPYCR